MNGQTNEVVFNFDNQTIVIRTRMFNNLSRFLAAHDTNKSKKHAFLLCDDPTISLCDLHLKMIDRLNNADESITV